MIDWTDPHTLLSQAASLQKMTLVFSGIYFYEFTSSLPYDWEVLRRLRGRPTTLVGNTLYLLCRYLALMTSICSCLLTSGYTTISCQGLLKSYSFSAVFGIASASTLLFVRAGIIWKWNRWVVILLSPFIAAIYASAIRTVVVFTSTFDPSIGQCTLNSAIQDRAISVAVFCGDLTLLAFILIGLRKGWREARKFPLWSILWNQGLVYFALAVMVEAPLMVFLLLNLNEVMNAMFVVPAVVMMAAGSTRFHRILTQYGGRAESRFRVPVQPMDRNAYELGDIPSRPIPRSSHPLTALDLTRQ